MHATGESQTDLGQALGLSQAQISRKQGKRARWTLDDCDAIAKHYGISTPDLLSGTDSALEALARKRNGPVA